MARPKKIDRPARLTVKIPSSLLTLFEERLYDPVHRRIPYGARAEVIARLIRGWLCGRDGDAYWQLVERVQRATTVQERDAALLSLLLYHDQARADLKEEVDLSDLTC